MPPGWRPWSFSTLPRSDRRRRPEASLTAWTSSTYSITMLIVRIELHSAVTGQVTTIATGKIVNTGTGSPTQGNYRIELRDAAGRKWKTGHIEGFPRKRLLGWDLLYRALEKLVGNRNRLQICALVCDLSSGEQQQPTRRNRTMIAQLPNLNAILKRHEIHPKFWPEIRAPRRRGPAAQQTNCGPA